MANSTITKKELVNKILANNNDFVIEDSYGYGYSFSLTSDKNQVEIYTIHTAYCKVYKYAGFVDFDHPYVIHMPDRTNLINIDKLTDIFLEPGVTIPDRSTKLFLANGKTIYTNSSVRTIEEADSLLYISDYTTIIALRRWDDNSPIIANYCTACDEKYYIEQSDWSKESYEKAKEWKCSCSEDWDTDEDCYNDQADAIDAGVNSQK